MDDPSDRSHYLLRAFVDHDAAAISGWAADPAEVRAWCSLDTAPVPVDVVAAWSRPADVEGWVLVDGGGPVGYGEVWVDHAAGEVELGHVIVDPHYRGQGIGALLVRGLVDRARRYFHTVALRVRPENAAARRCYERAGFTRADPEVERAWNEGQPHEYVWMVAR